ncbi:hypothetical protein A2671_01050, partial [Candidatus Kaiserbacteria bacterium RIFCSPHIGHO2_01_FULL_49_13]
MNWGVVGFSLLVAALLVAFSLSISVFAALPGSPLEVDGNSIVDSAADWDIVIDSTCDTIETGGSVTKGTCVTDPTSGDEGFTSGSKDINDISTWAYSTAPGEQSPPKNNIVHAFGAVYAVGGEQLLYFGMDRPSGANNGNATVGFWFLQNKAVLAPDGTFDSTSGGPATHTEGDLHIVAEFTNGGNIANLKLNKWQGGVLVNVFTTTPGTNVACNPGAPTTTLPAASVCVGVNNITSNLSWTGSVNPSIFFEGGINLTDLGFAANSCLAQFIAETRSSQENTATLHDFAMGDLSTCGTITITKDTIPNNAQDFSFTTFGTGLSPFSLDDDGETTILSNTKTFTGLLPGSYSVTETVQAGYNLTGLICTDPTTNTTWDTNTRTASIDVGASETVSCTFTNEPTQGTIELKKVWSGTAGQTTLNIGTSAGGTQVDSQLTGANGSAPLTTGQNTVNSGTYYLSETGGLTNYNTSALSCFNDVNDNGANDTEPAVSVGASDSVTVNPNDHVICTYTNTHQQGKIELQKDFSGTPENVTIKIGTSQNGLEVDSDVLSADGTDGEHTVDTGNYFVSETLTTPANYTSSLACYNDVNDNDAVDGGDTSHTVNTGTGEVAVGNSEDVLCVYTNTRNTGTVIVKKVMEGGTGTFNFTGTPSGSISVNNGTIQVTVDTGQYTSTETVPSSWDLTGISCDDSNSTGNTGTATATFNVESGETVTCVFTNQADANIIVQKQTDPEGDTTLFDFTTDYSSPFTLADNGSNNSGDLAPDTYNVAEGTETGWDLTSAVCTSSLGGSEDEDAIVLTAGETVTCVFTNQADANIIVQKQTDPEGDTTL